MTSHSLPRKMMAGSGFNQVFSGEVDIGDDTWFFAEIVHTDIWTSYDRAKSLLYWDGEYRVADKLVKGRE